MIRRKYASRGRHVRKNHSRLMWRSETLQLTTKLNKDVDIVSTYADTEME